MLGRIGSLIWKRVLSFINFCDVFRSLFIIGMKGISFFCGFILSGIKDEVDSFMFWLNLYSR